MNHYTHRTPGGCDPFAVDRSETDFDFETTEDLLNNARINSWKKFNDFSRFSIAKPSKYSEDQDYGLLMVEMIDGKFYVIGWVKYYKQVNLPIWKHLNENIIRSKAQ